MSSSDRNLLFGILALQMDFISRDALIVAMHDWVLDKAKSFGLSQQLVVGRWVGLRCLNAVNPAVGL
jgi:hypothetical protein